jgi:glycosyltransferase involved in cell wall biosynthesis
VFAGIVPGARRLMAAFDVVIHPSLWEGQPVVVQEALAERVPVVAAGTSGVRDLVRDGITGYVVEPGSPAEMASAAGAVLSCAAGETPPPAAPRAPLPAAALDELRRSHGAAFAVARHRELYDELLARR